MKLGNLSKNTLFAAAVFVSTLVPATIEASYIRPEIGMQTYRDFAENRGRFAAGATNVEIYYRDADGNYQSAGTIANIANFNCVIDGGYATLINPQFTVSVTHVGYTDNMTFSKRFIGEGGGGYGKIRDISADTDFKVTRVNRIVTEVAAVPIVSKTNAEIRALAGTDALILRVGGGTQEILTGTGTGSYIGYGWLSGGTIKVSYGSDQGSSVWFDYILPAGITEDSPLSSGALGGDSGSPSFLFNPETGKWEFLAAFAAYGWNNGGFQTRYFSNPNFVNNTIAGYISPTVDAAAANGNVLWNATDSAGAGTLVQGTNSWNFVGLANGVNAWGTTGTADVYGKISIVQNATDAQMDATRDLVFANMSGDGNVNLVLQGNIDMGAGSITFSENARYTIKSAVGENFRLNSAGFIVNAGATLTTEFTGAFGDEWRKIGDGSWTIAGMGDNLADLNLGGAGAVVLDRTGGYAANSILINGGVVTVVMKGENQLRTLENAETPTVKFGYLGGTLDVHGHDLAWNEIRHVDDGARIANYGTTDATFTFSGSGEQVFKGGFSDAFARDGAGGKLSLVANGGADASWTLTGTSAIAGTLAVESGTVCIEGTNTLHANNYVDADDWHYANFSASAVSVANGATFSVGSHSRVSANIEVAADGIFELREGTNKIEERVDGEFFLREIAQSEHQFSGNVALNGNAIYRANIATETMRTHAGNISGDAQSTFTKIGGGTLLLNGSGENFSGTVNLNAGTLRFSETTKFSSNTKWNGTGGTLELSGGTHAMTNAAGTLTVHAAAASALDYHVTETRSAGTGFSGALNLSMDVAAGKTLTLEGNSSALSAGTSSIALGENSALTLQDYAWKNTAGTLNIFGGAGAALTLNPGAVFGTAGALSIDAGTQLNFNGGALFASAGATLDIASVVNIDAASGGKLIFDLSTTQSTSTPFINFTGELANGSAAELVVSVENKHLLSNASWAIVDAGRISGLTLALNDTSGVRGDFSITKTGSIHTLSLSNAGALNVMWNGTAAAGTWEAGGAQVWTSAENGTDKFFQYDSATFGDVPGGNANQAIALAGDMRVGALSVAAENINYTFSGNAIFSDGGLTKSGAGTATFNTDVSGIRGDIAVSGGTLDIAHANGIGENRTWQAGRTLSLSGAGAKFALTNSDFSAAAGSHVSIDGGAEFSVSGKAEFASGTLAFGAGTLRTGGNLSAADISQFNAGQNVFVSGALGVENDLVVAGGNVSAGTLAFNSVSGRIRISAGTLNIAAASSLNRMLAMTGGKLVVNQNLTIGTAWNVSGNSEIDANGKTITLMKKSTFAGAKQTFGTFSLGDSLAGVDFGNGTDFGHTTTATFIGMQHRLSSSDSVISTLNVKAKHALSVTGSGGMSYWGGSGFSFGGKGSKITQNVNLNGTLNLLNVGGFYSYAADANVNVNSGGVLNVKNLNVSSDYAGRDSVAFNLADGGRINTANGIGTGSGAASGFALNISGGTIGILGSENNSWSTSRNLSLNGNLSIDTELQSVDAETGIASSTGIGGAIALSGVISGSGKLVKNGAGTLTLSGANTYGGGTNVNTGTLSVGNVSALGSGAIAISDGAKLSLALGAADATLANSISGAGTLEKTGAGALALSGNVAGFSGAWNISEGSKLALTNAGGSINAGANNISLNVDVLELGVVRENIFQTTGTMTLKDNAIITLDAIGVSAGSYTLLSAGTLNYSVVNGTLADKISLTGAEVEGERSRNLASAEIVNNALKVIIAGGAASITYTGDEWSLSESLSWNNAGEQDRFYNKDNVTFSDITGSPARTVNISGDVEPAKITVNAGTTNYTFSIENGGRIVGAASLKKSGAGTLTVSNTNTFTGGTEITGGVLIANASSALGTGAISVENARLQIATDDAVSGNAIRLNNGSTFDASTEAVNNAGTLSVDGNVTWNVTGTSALTKGISLAAGADLNVSPATAATFSSVISGAGALTKTGAGTLTLNAVNTFTGTLTVSGGILDVTATTSSGNGSAIGDGSNAIVVNDGATLRFSAKRSAGYHGGSLAINGGTVTMNHGGDTVDNSLGDYSLASGNTVMFDVAAGTIDGTGMWRRRDENNKIVVTQAASGSQISVAKMELRGVNAAIEVQGTANLTISSVIVSAASEGIVKSGAGTLTLSGTNTYSGGTNVNAGTLSAGNASALGSGAVAISDGAKLSLALGAADATFANSISGAGTLEKTGSGALTLSGNVAGFSGAWNIAGSKLALTNAGGNVNAGSNNISLNVDTLELGTVRENIFQTTGTLSLKNDATILIKSSADTLSEYTLLSAGTLDYVYTGNLADKIKIESVVERTKVSSAEVVDNALKITVVAETAALVWTGAQDSIWKIAGENNWENAGATADRFYNNDSVTFSSGARQSITLGSDVNPSSLTLSGAGTVVELETTSAYSLAVPATGAIALNDGAELNFSGTGGNAEMAFAGILSGNGTWKHTATTARTYKFTGDISGFSGDFNLGNANLVLGDGTVAEAGCTNALGDISANMLTVNYTGENVFNGNVTTRGELLLQGSGTKTFAKTANAGNVKIGLGAGATVFSKGVNTTGDFEIVGNNSTATLSGDSTIDGNILLYTNNENTNNSVTFTVNNGANVVANQLKTHQNANGFGQRNARINVNGGASLTFNSASTVLGGRGLVYFNVGGAGTLNFLGKFTVSSESGVAVTELIANGSSEVNMYKGIHFGSGNNGYWTHNYFTVNGLAKLNLGADITIANANSAKITLGDATVGSLSASGWSSSVMMTLNNASTGTTFNTQVYDTTSKTYSGEASSITLSGVISGAGKLIKDGAGTLTLSGANTYTGATNVNAGTLVLTGARTATAGNTTIAADATLDISSASGKLYGTGKHHNALVTVDGGTIKLGNANYGGSLGYKGLNSKFFVLQNGGTIELTSLGSSKQGFMVAATGGKMKFSSIGEYTVDVNDHANINLSDGALLEFNVVNEGTTATINKNIQKYTYNGNAENSGTSSTGSLAKLGAGTLALAGINTYTGTTAISEGTLIAGNAKALGGNGNVSVASGAKLQIASGVVLNKSGAAVTFAEGAKLLVDLSGKVGTAEEKFTLDLISATAFSVNGTELSASNVNALMSNSYELVGGDWRTWLQTWSLQDDTLKLTMAIPEPSLFGLLAGLSALALAGTRRRRK